MKISSNDGFFTLEVGNGMIELVMPGLDTLMERVDKKELREAIENGSPFWLFSKRALVTPTPQGILFLIESKLQVWFDRKTILSGLTQ